VIDQKLISAAIWIIGLILIPYASTNALEGTPIYLLIVGGFSFLLFVFFVLKNRVCALPLLGMFFVGKLNFLPFGLTAMAIFTIAMIIYFFFDYFALKQRSLSTGPMYLFIPILIITLIIAYHNRTVGLHALGSTTEGSAMALMMLLGSFAYICGASMSSPPNIFWVRLPLYCTLMGLVSSLPNLITTFFPQSAPYLYLVSDAVNVDAYRESLGMDTDVARIGSLTLLGNYLEVFLLANYPIHTWWRPHRWWVPILLTGCLILTVLGGFRGAVVIFGAIFIMATWCYYSWRSVFILPTAIVAAYGLSLGAQSGLVELPVSMQRSLSFLPGTWDATAVESATASNEFRSNIAKVYEREELYKSPWIGNGFTFDAKVQEMYEDMARKGDAEDHYYMIKSFIVSKTYHVGWISLYDMIGLIGGAAFVALGASMLCLAIYFVWKQADFNAPLFPLKVWILCNIFHEFAGYFALFGDIRSAFPNMCAYAIVLVQLHKIERDVSLNSTLAPFQQHGDTPNPSKLIPQPA